MLKTSHLQMPIDEWHNLYNLKVSLENTISSCSDSAFGSDVRLEIQTILENTEKKIQRILDKNFSVKPKDFDKYNIVICKDGKFDFKDDCRTISEAKKLAKEYYNDGCSDVGIFCRRRLVWEINELHPKGYDSRK